MPPSCKPVTLGLEPTFGFGDRLGLATAGHLDGLAQAGGVGALEAEGFTGPWGADADHLKTEADVDVTAEAGFVFFTIDPSEHVDDRADSYSRDELKAKFK